MRFTIEFQPSGIRLVCNESLTLLDAARQAGVSLRSDCGGAGICGKCVIQIISDLTSFPPTQTDSKLLSAEQLASGQRLACETVVNRDMKVQIPSNSVIDGQILQISGTHRDAQPDPLISQKMVRLEEATLEDLVSDYSRLERAAGRTSLNTSLDNLRRLPVLLRENKWQANLLLNGDRLAAITKQKMPRLLGLAVDVGSTKLACYLMDLESGETLAAKGVPNPQIIYGEDIMARLAYSIKNTDRSNSLHTLLMKSINQAAQDLCAQIGAKPSDIADACLVGNTAMHHYFLDLPVESLAFSPFVPVISDALSAPAVEIGLDTMAGSSLYAPAVIAGFVGSDHLAFLLAEGFSDDKRVRLGIDIGTNTEIALRKGEMLVSVSTASGPAFEGAHIRFGMRAAPGAIEHVSLDKQGKATIDVIGGRPPVGICGSGILDLISEMRRQGLLNQRGRIEKTAPGIRLDENGKPFIILAEADKQITLSQSDVDQILLAKGAIRAGIDVLMDHLNVNAGEIDEVVIAGAFGSFMNPGHAMGIGMLPEISLERVRTAGNAAGTGARMMLISKSTRRQAEELAKRIQYLELTVYPEFPLFYARGIQA